jgi:hypothetical protein
MKARLLVLVIAAALAAAGAASHLTHRHRTAADAPPVTLVGQPVDVSSVDGGWWDWHKSDL